MLEKELKLMLTEEEYKALERALVPESEVTQVNHYYYSPLCSAQRISVRVREVNGKDLLQVKLPVSTEGALAVREELEKELACVPDTVSARTLTEVCGVSDDAVHLGSLTTLRKLSHRFEGVELCLDKNEYLGVTDYELEAEYEGEYPEEVLGFIRSCGISTEQTARGKYSRFLEALREKEGSSI